MTGGPAWVVVSLLVGVGGAVGAVLGAWSARRRAALQAAATESWLGSERAAAVAECSQIRQAAQLAALEEAQSAGLAFDTAAAAREGALVARAAQLDSRRRATAALEAEIAARREKLDALRSGQRAREGQLRALEAEHARLLVDRRRALELRAGQTAGQLRATIMEGESELARVSGQQMLRAIEAAANDAEHVRHAKRVMGIAVGRFSGHYLTERLMSIVNPPPGIAFEHWVGPEQANLRAIEPFANVKIAPTEDGAAVRLEGLDGVGREVARRALTWIGRHPKAAPAAVSVATKDIVGGLERELMELGKRAFATLEIPAAHTEIVALVGRLNYRTSFTQNQWKHAVEAAFLCGMMADELGLDMKLARRAALMHDIGKALTHELDGSHAVIGADYARRLGEAEIVANAIGAHHTDEPFSSPYAYLVAAADAMSGARPGARRQMEDNYVARLDDLERITRSFRGVEEAFAVQGGREVRIYVAEDKIDDRGAIGLSTEIARRISEEMTFPGQIRVTVIRELKAVEIAN
jgi:ribonuclease Y